MTHAACTTALFVHVAGPLPFGKFADRNDAHAWMQASHVDPARFRPMVDTHWGDIIDVVDNSSVLLDPSTPLPRVHFLTAYDVIVWTGDGTLPAATAAGVRDVIAVHGCTLVVAAGTVTPAHAALTGVAVTGGLLAVRAWEWLPRMDGTDGGKDGGTGGTRHAHANTGESEPLLAAEASVGGGANVTVVARSVPEGHPLVVRRAVGRGVVFTCLVPWFEGGSSGLSRIATALLERVVQPVQPVAIAQPSPVSPLALTSSVAPHSLARHNTTLANDSAVRNSTTMQRIVVAANNAGGVWFGTLHVEVPNMDTGANRTCTRVACRVLFAGTTGNNTIECADMVHLKHPPMWTPRDNTASTVGAATVRIEAQDVVVFAVWCMT